MLRVVPPDHQAVGPFGFALLRLRVLSASFFQTVDGAIMRPRIILLTFVLGLGCVATAYAQTPRSVERVRARIEALRGGPGGSTVVVVPSAEASGSEAVTQGDLNRLERRLIRLIREMARTSGSSPPREEAPSPREEAPETERPRERPVPPADTVRVGPDSVRAVERIVLLADTVQQTTVMAIRESLLDTGVFRAFEVNFAFGEHALLPRAERTLNAVGQVLVDAPQLRVKIAGHTDAVGPDSVNQTLSKNRAAAVKTYLVETFGLRPDRLTTRGYGETQPIASNESAGTRALNRRVKFVARNPSVLEPSDSPPADTLRLSNEALRQLVRDVVRAELERMASDSTRHR